MMAFFRTTEISAQEKTTSPEARSFNPDRRIETGRKSDSPAESFNPDKRLSDLGTLADARNDVANTEDFEISLEKVVGEYVKELKEFSEVPDTIPDKPFESSELEKLSPEQNRERHKEFFAKKADLRKQWETANGIEWPKYEHDIITTSGVVVRVAGSYYDMHHIKPLCLGGENEVGNITPLSVDKHLTKQGIHRQGGPCDGMTKLVIEGQQ